MAWSGGCLCGAVRYRSESAPFRVTHCHCGDCRRISGAAFLTSVAFKTEDFVWSGEAPSRYRSSEGAERAFCAKCGSTLGIIEHALPHWTQVTLGSLDRPQDVSPEDHIWVQSRLPWLKIDDGLPGFARDSPRGGLED